jgi:hypothetical protein
MRRKRIKQGVEATPEQGTRDAAFYFFCAFIISYFTRITARVGFLGTIHFDLILAALTATAIAFSAQRHRGGRRNGPGGAAAVDPAGLYLSPSHSSNGRAASSAT